MIPKTGGGQIKALELEFKPLQEIIGQYELSDGTILEARLIALKALRAIDKEAKDKIFRKEDGEPLYNLRFQVAVTAKVKEALLKQD